MFDEIDIQTAIHQGIFNENSTDAWLNTSHALFGAFTAGMATTERQLVGDLEDFVYRDIWKLTLFPVEPPLFEVAPMDTRVRDMLQSPLHSLVLDTLSQFVFSRLCRDTEVHAEPLLAFQEQVHISIWLEEEEFARN